MSDKLYRIRKLVWVEELTGDVGFAVLKATIGESEYYLCDKRGRYSWRLYINDHYDGSSDLMGTLDAAKLAAEAHLVSRLESCLEVAKCEECEERRLDDIPGRDN